MKAEKNRPLFLIIGLFAGVTAALAWVGVSLIRWKEFGDFFPFSAIGAILLFIGFACAAIRATGVRGRQGDTL